MASADWSEPAGIPSPSTPPPALTGGTSSEASAAGIGAPTDPRTDPDNDDAALAHYNAWLARLAAGKPRQPAPDQPPR